MAEDRKVIEELKTCDHLAYIMGEDNSGDEDLEDMGKAWRQMLKNTFGRREVDAMLGQLENNLYPTLRSESEESSKSSETLLSQGLSNKLASTSTTVFGRRTYRSQKVVEDECQDESKRLFNFDFGSLDAEVNTLKEKLDSMTFNEGDVDPLAKTKSLYNIFSTNMERAGVKTLLNRIALIFEMDIRENFPEEGFLTRMVARTDMVFAKELGRISGFLLSYPSHTLLLMEGPEIAIADVFIQFNASSVSSMIARGKVLIIATDVLVRYMDDWTEFAYEAPPGPGPVLDERDVNECLVILGDRCRRLWRKIRREKSKGPFMGKCFEKRKILPEVNLLMYALDCPVLRNYHCWLKELTGLSLFQLEEVWPEPSYLIPTMAHKKDPEMDGLGAAIRASEDPLESLNPDLDLFLNGGRCTKIQFFRDGSNAPYVDPELEEDESSTSSEEETGPGAGRHRLKDTVATRRHKKKPRLRSAEKRLG